MGQVLPKSQPPLLGLDIGPHPADGPWVGEGWVWRIDDELTMQGIIINCERFYKGKVKDALRMCNEELAFGGSGRASPEKETIRELKTMGLKKQRG